MKKELRPVHDVVTCDVCGRTILKGERTEAYLAPGGHRHQVCDLCCGARASTPAGSASPPPATCRQRMPRSEPRGGLLGRMRRRRPEPEAPGRDLAELEATYGSGEGAEPAEHEEPAAAAVPPPRARTRPKDPRHVRAVPTTAEAKVERALDLFNGSDHQRTIAGLARTLGEPFVSTQPDVGQGSQVSVVVAWELRGIAIAWISATRATP